jgi:uncharacterized protein YprB with RNaseH-like and TPR domain
MVILYLDIEIDSQGEEPHPSDKIITIQYKELRGKLVVLKEWDWREDGEKRIVKDFYDYLTSIMSKEKVQIIGFNIFRFDVPFLIYKLVHLDIDTLEHAIEKFRKVYWRDLRYCLYPFNNFSFQGLTEREVAEKLGLKQPEPPSKDIPKFYRMKIYDKIIEHIESEFKFFEDLNWKLTHELDDVIARYKGTNCRTLT